MENPTFHLEGIIRSKEEMEDFEGPLNLILMLLNKNKIEIRDIQISLILEQYLEHIAKMQEMDLEVASEFVQMASHLVYIKTRTLLAGDEEVSELDLLISSLEQLKCRDAYSAVKATVPELSAMSEQGRYLLPKAPEPLPLDGRREYRYRHEPVELLRALASALLRGGQAVEEPYIPPAVPKRIIYGVRDKSRQLLELLRQKGQMSLQSLYALSESRSEVVATFISILELCSLGNLQITACEDDFQVYFTGDAADTETILESISE